jgi:hypothetical protein
MIRSILLVATVLLGYLGTASFAAPVEYVKVCTLYGANFFYSPGTDTCVHVSTGEARTQTAQGTMVRETSLAGRVRALESGYCDDCFAVVRSNGISSRSLSLTSSKRVGVGNFQVVFGKPIAQCAFNATLGNADDQEQPPLPGMITVGRTPVTEFRGVSVRTFDAWGRPADRDFHLSMECRTRQSPICQVYTADGPRPCTPGSVPPFGLPPY